MERLTRRLMSQEFVRPGNEVLPVRTIRMTTVVLPPRELSVEHADVDRRHLLLHVVVGSSEVLGAKQPKHGSGCDSSHIAALMVEPLRVAFFRNAIADEG